MSAQRFELKASGLVCARGGRVVLDNVSFTARPGAPLVITGPNGVGKSTLLRVVAGFLPLIRGRLVFTDPFFGEAAPPAPPEPSRLHYVGHRDGIKPALSVRDHLAFWARYMDAEASSVERALEGFALTRLADLPGAVLSAGQQRRVALARVLLAWRPLWLLDEPSVSLDTAARAILRRAIADHGAQGGIALVTSHDSLHIPGSVEVVLRARAHEGAL